MTEFSPAALGGAVAERTATLNSDFITQVAVGETVFSAAPLSPFSRRFNRTGEVPSAK